MPILSPRFIFGLCAGICVAGFLPRPILVTIAISFVTVVRLYLNISYEICEEMRIIALAQLLYPGHRHGFKIMYGQQRAETKLGTVLDNWGASLAILDQNAPEYVLPVATPLVYSSKEEALQAMGKFMADELSLLTGSRGGQGF